MTPSSTSDLIAAQKELETRATAEGYERFIKHQKTVADNEGHYATTEGSKLVKGSIAIVADAIRDYINSASNNGKGRTPMAYSILKEFEPEALAFLTLNQIYQGVIAKHSLTNIFYNVGASVETEVIARLLEQQRSQKVAERVRQKVAKQGSSKNKVKAFKKLAKDNLDDLEIWDNPSKVRVAEPLVNAVLSALPEIFVLKFIRSGARHTEQVLELTDKAVELLASFKDASAWLDPVHRPMVVMPRRWEAMDTGCYYDDKAKRTVKLVRTFNKDHRRIVQKAIDNGQMDYCLEAINAIQETPWAINTKVLEVLKIVYETDLGIEGVPRRTLLALPPKLEKEVWEGMSDKQRKGHRLTLSGIHEQNRRIVGERAVLDRDLEIAEDLARYQRFYLPQNMDFRGRVYPVPHFNNQRADHIKALFKFAEGECLGEGGAGWLAVHLANCGDFGKVSKKPFHERVQWVTDNEQDILDAAADPIGTAWWWGEADSPFCFLAACFEYAEWVESGRSDAFVSYIPVALDGSNSGLQHYSAALRAEKEAELVSLMPTEKPMDLYQIVADRVKAEVEKDLNSDDELTRRVAAVALENGVTRSLVKRNVMTYAYSSAQFGFRNQIMEDTIRPYDTQVLMGKKDKNPYSVTLEDGTVDGGFKAANYLAGKVYRAVTATVSKAEEGMSFFKDLASVMAHEGLPLVWTNPVGLPVMHKYPVWDVKRVDLFMSSKPTHVVNASAEGDSLVRLQLNIRTKPTSKIDKSKARSAVAPNVIHSMDAAHLLLTVLAAKEEGYSCFSLIHDSFGTHAGKTDRFFSIIREAFVGMYEAYDPFEELLEEARETIVDESKLPTPPSKGIFDINQVLEADYAFA